MNLKNKRIFLISLFTLMLSNLVFCQDITPSPDQKHYARQDIKFELFIPNAQAASVQIQTPNLPYGVSLKTLRKTEQYGENNGTLVELWFYFEKPGNYELPRLTVLVQSKKKYFYFEPVTINDNPANMLPRMVVEFENGTIVSSDMNSPSKPVFTAKIGEKIHFKVNLQYATQLVNFSWDIPKDSIFTQTDTYEITEIKYREKNYTDALIPVADFEWTSLSKGINQMPKIKLTATGYNGYRNELLLPPVSINFVNSGDENTAGSTQEEDFYNAAFQTVYEDRLIKSSQKITYKDCQILANLRNLEKHSFFKHGEYKKQRIALEQELGLSSDSDEFFSGFLYICGAVFAALVVVLLITIKRKKYVQLICTCVLLVVTTVPLIYSITKITPSYGIAYCAELHPVPEEDTNITGEIEPGNRVLISEKAGEWYFVELGTISGWTKADYILE